MIARVSRPQYLAYMRDIWQQGEHVVLMGPTGSGKTTIARDLLQIRKYVCVLAIKTRDDTLDTFKGPYSVITHWPPLYNQHHVILWIKPRELGDFAYMHAAISDALRAIYLEGGWCIGLDDLSYMVDHLRLRNTIVAFLNQGRSSGISVVSSVQRPRRVPLEAFNQARHILLWRYDDVDEVKRAAEIAGKNHREVLEWQRDLEPFDAIALSSRRVPLIVSAK